MGKNSGIAFGGIVRLALTNDQDSIKTLELIRISVLKKSIPILKVALNKKSNKKINPTIWDIRRNMFEQ